MKKKEIELIYNADYTKDKEALAVLSSLSDYILNERNIQKESMTRRQIAQLATDLNIKLVDLLDHQSKHYSEKLNNLSEDDLLQTIEKNMSLLKTPILVKENSTVFMKSPYEAYAKDLELK